MMWTSSTPASAAIVSTCSMIRWRRSGRRIFGSGRLTSSNAIVSFMPGNSSVGSGSMSIGLSSALRIAPSMSSIGVVRLGRVDHAAAVGRQLLEAEPFAVPEQWRCRAVESSTVDVEYEGRGSEASTVEYSTGDRGHHGSKAIFTAPRRPAVAAWAMASTWSTSG